MPVLNTFSIILFCLVTNNRFPIQIYEKKLSSLPRFTLIKWSELLHIQPMVFTRNSQICLKIAGLGAMDQGTGGPDLPKVYTTTVYKVIAAFSQLNPEHIKRACINYCFPS